MRTHPGFDPALRAQMGAGLAFLQPGIDPVFLVLLSAHAGVGLEDHGLIVGASQAGMAAGALVTAVLPRLPRAALGMAAAAGIAASLATAGAAGFPALLAARGLFGFTAGLLYAAQLRSATATAPAHGMGMILVFQLVFAALVGMVLPEIAARAGPSAALACLAAVPLANLVLIAGAPDRVEPAAPRRLATPYRIDAASAAVVLYVAASMMIWSYIGARAVSLGLSDAAVGAGVAAGSVAAGVAALAVARGAPTLPTPASGLLAALALASPFVTGTSTLGFVAAMILFNIGATYSVARFSARAIERQDSARSAVPALHGIAMVIGPFVGAAAVAAGGYAALATIAALALVAAVAALVIDGQRGDAASANGAKGRFLEKLAVGAGRP